MDGEHLRARTRERHERVDAVLDGFFSLAKRRAESVGSRYVDLWSVLERNSAGGKRFRPRMVFTAYDALGGDDDDAVAGVGAAFELLHTALIVHDDVIDRDFSRRGIPNVSGSYRDTATTAGLSTPAAEHRGMSAAVIAGDLALTGASRLLMQVRCGGGVQARLLDILDEAIFVSAGGEMVDVELSLSPEVPTVDEILDMERAKTAVYSFEAPLQAGAVLAGAPEAVVQAVGEFGREVGVAYQVVDDLLGVFGTEESTGKTTLGDLREGKRTVLIAHAATTDEWFAIQPFIGKADLSVDEAAHVRARLESCGARSFAESLVEQHARRALDVLDGPEVTDTLRAALSPLVATVLERVR
ncbi:polyprenyl synthetase family protein [Frigoribacterium faeni]|uniref:Geranylgeranyl diphosphate synthase type II n=2 Tax=Frigoribacterium faeni TaxID=145483 RepID=A0A7W3JKH4_9MICO|nr:polyprenyl synthetase family protein [Frigoribacterium faeni]MBA8814450.1 geranylgeranyl diphosphate synthase type II [Frigoribacterium faeni]